MRIILDSVEVRRLKEAFSSHVAGRPELDDWFRSTHALHDSAARMINCVAGLAREGADLPDEIALEVVSDGETPVQQPLEVKCCEWLNTGEPESA
jgi:hypothetical protein